MTKAKPMKFRTHSWMTVAGLLGGTVLIGAVTHDRDESSAGGGEATHLTASADGSVTLTGRLDRSAVLQGTDGLVHLELLIASRRPSDRDLPRRPTDLVVVLDRSGSMQGEKIQQARAAIHQLISQLGPQDRFGLVVFSSDAQVAIPLTLAASGAATGWSATVDGLGAGGGTFMQPALALGLGMVERSQTAGRSPRVMLLSDGLASETPDVLRAEAARAARGEFPLSTLGIGSDFDESLMSSLADTGAGNYYYLRDPGRLAEILDDEFATARATVASGLAVTLAPGDGVEVIDAAGYPLERDRRGVTFRPGTLFAGQQRRIWVTLRVPTDLAVERSLGDVALRFDEAGVPRRIELPDLPRIATVETEQQFLSGLDGERWADAVAVEEWGDLRQKVGRYVQQGRRDAALSAIDAFQARIAPLQTAHPEPEVARKLEDASALEASVAEVFDAPDAPAARNRLGKDLHAQSTLDRRVGDRI